MSNFEIIEWLIKDGGHYTREQHISLLQVNFPDADITETKVTSIRQSMTTSRFVKVDVIETKNSGRLVKALAVDPEYKRYSRIRNREPEIVPRAWLNDEPKCVVDCINRVRWFNQLLSTATHQRAY